MKTTEYFRYSHAKLDRAWIKESWIEQTLKAPEWENIQADGRFQRWRRIPEANNRILRVVVLADGETVHNAFFDRSFDPQNQEM